MHNSAYSLHRAQRHDHQAVDVLALLVLLLALEQISPGAALREEPYRDRYLPQSGGVAHQGLAEATGRAGPWTHYARRPAARSVSPRQCHRPQPPLHAGEEEQVLPDPTLLRATRARVTFAISLPIVYPPLPQWEQARHLS